MAKSIESSASDTGIRDWVSWGGEWYYLADSGAMATGWFQDATGTWYFADASGAMLSNCWVGDYYLTGSGAMATSQWIGPYWVGADGKWVPSA